MGALADMYRQYGYEHGKNWDSMWDEELISRFNTKNPQVKKLADNFLTWGDDSEYKLAQELWITGWPSIVLDEKAKQDLKDNLWDEVWGSVKTKVNVPINSVKKWGQRTLNDLWLKIYGEILKDTVWDTILWDMGIDADNYVEQLVDNAIAPVEQENIIGYQNKVNENYRALEQKNMDQNVQRYYEGRWYTSLLKEWDFRGFLYKTVWDAAQNWEMPAVVAVSVLQPEIWLALMATDTYARENQEAFEAMMDNWATYDQAEKWGVVVWLVNSAVEVWLEKLIWWVETGASKAIRNAFMKNVQEEAVKKWLGRLLAEWTLQQLKASWEEWLEEIVQTIVQNAAIKTVNQNQDLFEWVGQAFEWGFYNPMNLLVGGWNLAANRSAIKQSLQGRWNTNIDVDSWNWWDTWGGWNSWWWIIDRITDWGAQKITGTVSAQDKLYKAQEPRMNVLSNKKNLERRRANSDRANVLIVENGYTPTNTAERLEAHQSTLNKLWSQIKEQVNKWKWVTVDQTPIIEALRNYIEEKKALNIAWVESDIAALEKELASMERAQAEGKTDLPILENKKQVFNDIIDWKGQEASEVYKWGIKLITQEIWKIEDSILSELPWEFAQQKRDVGALLDTYEDVFKADMKNQRSKWLWLAETYSRIEWIWDIIEWATGIFKWDWGKVLKWAGKVLLWKSLAKAKDVDFLIEQWFKELAAEMNKNQENNQTYKNQIDEWAQPVQEMTPEEENQQAVNRIMTMDEAKQILEMAWNANNLKEFYEWEYNNAEERLRWAWSDEVENYAQNTYATQKMIEAHPELLDWDYYFSEVLDAYLNGTLVWNTGTDGGSIDLSESTWYEGRKFYEPRNIEWGKELWDKANTRVTKSNRDEIYKARADFIINAHTPWYIESLWLSQQDVNKKLMAWTSYPKAAAELSKKINQWVAEENRWTWLENSSLVNEISVTDDQLGGMVKEIKWTSQDYERKYIANAMLALDTHIDWGNLTFDFIGGNLFNARLDKNVLWDYNPLNDLIRIGTAWQNTVAHEMGHYLDHLRARQLFWYNVVLSEWGTHWVQNLTEDQKAFVEHFGRFMTNLKLNADIKNSYTMDSSEIFARFVWRFTERVRNKATNGRFWFETKYYNDKFLEKDYIEFTKILQEKAKLDVTNEYPNYEAFLLRRSNTDWAADDSSIQYERTEGNLNDLKKEYYYVISPNYEITTWGDTNVHWALDYMLEKKGIKNVGNAILSKLKALNDKLPKVRSWDDVNNLSPIDQFWYDLKDKIIETYIMKKNTNWSFIVKDLDHWSVWDWSYPNKTFVDMEIWHIPASLHMSQFLYTKLKDEWFIR